MTPEMILLECKDRGIALRLEGDSIRYEGPDGSMTVKLLGAIKDNKPGLVEHLRMLVRRRNLPVIPGGSKNSPVETHKPYVQTSIKQDESSSLFEGIFAGSSFTDPIDIPDIPDFPIEEDHSGIGPEHLLETTKSVGSPEAKIEVSFTPPDSVFISEEIGGIDLTAYGVEIKNSPPPGISPVNFGEVPKNEPISGPWATIDVQSPPRPLPWRSILATWPIPERERWGRLAERNEHDGHPWDEAERLAFEEVNGGPARRSQFRDAEMAEGREEARFERIVEWWDGGEPATFTPAEYREAVREATGRIECDKATKGRAYP